MPTPQRPGGPGGQRPGPPRPGAPRPGAPRPAAQKPPRPKRTNALLERVKSVLFQPGDAWRTIAGEFTTVGAIYKSYAMPLAAIPAVCGTLGNILWGMSVPFYGRIPVPFTTALQVGAAQYALSLASVFVLGLIISGLAETFGGAGNQVQGVKIAAYGATASWLAGAFALVPGAGWLQLLGLYSLYVMYTGLSPVMKAPRDRVIGYAVLVLVAAIVLFIVGAGVIGFFLPTGGR